MDLYCVGQIVVDVLVKPVDDVNFDIDTKKVDDIFLRTGGDCSNAAIVLSKLGNEVGITMRIGKDCFGDFALREMKKNGIDITGLKISEETSTSVCVVLINMEGKRTFLYYGGANELLKYEDVIISFIEKTNIVHVGGTFLLPNFDGEGATKLFKIAKEKKKLTSMYVSWDTTGRWLEIIKPCLKYLDFFMPSYEEAKKITGKKDPGDMAVFLQNEGVKTVVIKLGEKGCYVKGAEKEGFHIPAYDVKAIDTTGAGDSFV
ncbi:MAG: carbohydrate kinase family protein, partial [Actinobacteria bacterium]|nr:carbohydrate kinase family protein [Actinomycetota bacterium]